MDDSREAFFQAVLFCCVVGFVRVMSAAESDAPITVPPAAVTSSVPATTLVSTNHEAPTNQTDYAAQKFMNSCAGCHSLFGLKLTGPELSHVGAWPVDQLQTAIKRMQEKVGPLQEAEVSNLSDLLRDAQVRERLKAEEARIQAQFMAKMDPPNAMLGKNLFFGRKPLQNGGLGCVNCHAVEGTGGTLGLDLTGVFAKMGETPLISAIEKASFKIMQPHYQRHPITRQEAIHLAKYLSTLDPQKAATVKASFVPIGAGGALALLAALTFYYKNQRKNRNVKLQRRRK